jgi:hypothetical protein
MTTSAISRLGRSPEEGIKAPVKTSTTGPITLKGTGQTLNGVVTSTSDRVLVKDQTLDAENGIYLVGADDWERATDMNAADDVDNGQLVSDANTGVLYVIVVATVWSPDATPINFDVLVGAMPAQIVLTSSATIDLVDHDVALVTGALDPSISQHLEYDHTSIQAKSDDTTAADMNLNPLGGDVVAAGVSITAHAAAFVAHAGDATIHFTEGSIDHAAILNIGVNSHAAIDTHIADATLHFTEASIDHVNILNIGTNSHAAIDTHIADATIHFTQAAISIPASQISDFDVEVANNAAVTANTAKVTNNPTSLSVGTVTATTFGITSDGSANDVVIPLFTDADAGLVRGSGGGTANFLRADATFAVPPGTNNLVVVTEVTTARTAVAFECILVDDDTAAGVVTITLPPSVADDIVVVKKLGTTADVICDGDAAEPIEGVATFTLTAQFASVTLIADGTGWHII